MLTMRFILKTAKHYLCTWTNLSKNTSIKRCIYFLYEDISLQYHFGESMLYLLHIHTV